MFHTNPMFSCSKLSSFLFLSLYVSNFFISGGYQGATIRKIILETERYQTKYSQLHGVGLGVVQVLIPSAAKNYSSPSLFNLFRDAGQVKSEEATSPTTENKMKIISKITTELERAIIPEFRSKKLTQITESDVFCKLLI